MATFALVINMQLARKESAANASARLLSEATKVVEKLGDCKEDLPSYLIDEHKGLETGKKKKRVQQVHKWEASSKNAAAVGVSSSSRLASSALVSRQPCHPSCPSGWSHQTLALCASWSSACHHHQSSCSTDQSQVQDHRQVHHHSHSPWSNRREQS